MNNAGSGVLINDAAVANESVILEPTAGVFNWGLGKSGDRKNSVQFPLTTADQGMTWGGDTNLYRPQANRWKTDDDLHVGAEFRHLGSTLGFFNAAAVTKPTVTGAKGGNAALTSLIAQLVALGLITDSTT
jgi:hypothetical protein